MDSAGSGTPPPPPLYAWLVHAFTASGVVLAFLALAAIEARDWRLALIWLAAALAVDGLDGTLARWAHVKTALPRIDGAALDLVVDYLNYVLVPAVFIWRAQLVPEPLALPLCGLILVSALYNFARADMKTDDHYFRGFPALWNLVAFYLYVAQIGAGAGAIIVFLLAAMTLAPVHVVHPFRVRDHGAWLPLLALAWAAASGALLWPGWTEAARTGLLAISFAAAALLVALGLLRTLRGSR